MDEDPDAPYSPSYELVRTAFKVGLGKRGDAVAEFLDRRRDQRAHQRTVLLAREAEAAGLDPEALLERVKSDDHALELLEDVVSAARDSRSEDKIRYLGRCLANALATDDDAAIDATWLRLAAIRDLEAPHVRLMAEIATGQKYLGWSDGVPEPELVKPEREEGPQPPWALKRRAPRLHQLDRATFEPLVATLVRTGLVTADTSYDLEIETEVLGKSIEEIEVASQPNLDTMVRYLLTTLGREILSDIQRSPS